MILKSMLRVERDEKGIVLILTALLIVPFVVLLGVATDVGRLLVVKNQLATVVDAAAIALAKKPSLTDQTAEQTLVNAFRDADFSSQTGITFTTPTVQRSNNNLTVDVTCHGDDQHQFRHSNRLSYAIDNSAFASCRGAKSPGSRAGAR